MNYTEFYDEMNAHYYRANCYHTMKDPDQDCTSGNHHVLNATYHLISQKICYTRTYSNLDDMDKEIKFLKSTQVEPGLFNRHPNKASDQETQDDYFGILVSSRMMLLPPRYEVYHYAKTHSYYVDNLKGKFSLANWFGRFWGLPAVYKKAAGGTPNIFNRIGFCMAIIIDLLFPGKTSDTSGRILQWLKNYIMKGDSKLTDYFIRLWEKRIKKDYPNGYMGEVLGIYHGADHPFSKAMLMRV